MSSKFYIAFADEGRQPLTGDASHDIIAARKVLMSKTFGTKQRWLEDAEGEKIAFGFPESDTRNWDVTDYGGNCRTCGHAFLGPKRAPSCALCYAKAQSEDEALLAAPAPDNLIERLNDMGIQCCDLAAAEITRLRDQLKHLSSALGEKVNASSGVYIASKAVAHGPRWKKLRDDRFPIISTWIDESAPDATLDWPDLWDRCLSEATSAEVLIVYREPGEVLKGAWVEVGAALAAGVKVIGVGIDEFSIAKSGKILLCSTMHEALETARGIMDGNAYLREEIEEQSN